MSIVPGVSFLKNSNEFSCYIVVGPGIIDVFEFLINGERTPAESGNDIEIVSTYVVVGEYI